MAFVDITALQTYIDQYIITNGTNSITGAELNTALTGINQFLISTSGITNIYSGNFNSSPSGATLINIPHNIGHKPNSVVITPKNNHAGDAILDGYYLQYDITYISINFLNTISLVNTYNFDWLAI